MWQTSRMAEHTDSARLSEWLQAEAAQVRAVASVADPERPVPSCPDWLLGDVLHHLGAVYLHKVACMRSGSPTLWPPDGMADEDPLALFDRAWRDLTTEFATRAPQSHSYTWFAPDQSVVFWTRRMAHETVVHRVDVELAAGVPVTAVPADVARDGIDELLMVFLAYGSRAWTDQYEDVLAGVRSPVTVRVQTALASWLVRITSDGIDVSQLDPDIESDDQNHAMVRGESGALFLWLWNRAADDEVTVTGSPEAVALLRECLTAGTQ